jgi:hypothetical protein
LEKLLHALRAPSLPINGRKKDLSSRFIDYQRKQSTQGSAESSIAAPPPSDTIAGAEEDSEAEEQLRSAWHSRSSEEIEREKEKKRK